MQKRNERQDAIREIVRNQPVKTQRELADALKSTGFVCTQATVSRDISDMGLKKLSEGMYALPEDLRLQHMVEQFVETMVVAQNQMIIHTSPGTANSVAIAIDDADLDIILGTLAGDDTILLICADNEHALLAQRLFSQLKNHVAISNLLFAHKRL